MAKHYDYLVVGAGLTGSVFAYEAKAAGKSCLVIDKRNHLAGNIYTREQDGIMVHEYGAHIFHTSNEQVWSYVQRFATFNNYINSPIARWHDKVYNLPFNMNTFSQMWGISTPQEAQDIIAKQVSQEAIDEPKNLEEQALSLVGRDIFERLVKEYTEKQWGRACSELPASIIKRLPCRFTYDNNYFNDRYQGIPEQGYTKLIENMLDGIDVQLGISYNELKASGDIDFDKVVYCGPIDEFFDFNLGTLEYRSLRFEHETKDMPNYQGIAVQNFTDHSVAFTRIIEHKHFVFGSQPTTIITKEYPAQWTPGSEPYYPINDAKNTELYHKYVEQAKEYPHIIFAGRLGGYKYYDMDKAIESALIMAQQELKTSTIF